MDRDVIHELTVWLTEESRKHLGLRTHDLHLTDWEVRALLGALRSLVDEDRNQCGRDEAMRRAAKEQKAQVISHSCGCQIAYCSDHEPRKPRIEPDYTWGSVGSPTMKDLEHYGWPR